MGRESTPPLDGATQFVRYAYPPNRLGYCGPADPDALAAYVAAGVSDPGLRRLVVAFDGAYPYLELIAGASGIADPLDVRVVEAYWLGNRLLTNVDMGLLGGEVTERFRSRAGRHWDRLAESVWAGGVPHHSFHVFAVYPWVGLLREGRVDEPLRVLDRCRIRWGTVEQAVDGGLLVRSRLLEWAGVTLRLGAPTLEQVSVAPGVDVQVGDVVALHWEWICGRLAAFQLANLRRYSAHHLRLVNEELAVPIGAVEGR